MKLQLFFFLLISIFPVRFCLSQADEKFFIGNDSLYRYQGIIPPIEFRYDLNQLFEKPLTSQFSEDVLFQNNPSTIWLRTELFIMNNSQSDLGDINTHFTSPLYQQYLRDSEFDMLKYVLGTVQAGVVGYMAYKHIKKYGFWK